MKLVRVTAQNRCTLGPGIAALEAIASYPLGEDRFTIDHGTDYFAFFERLGELAYYALLDGPRVVAVGCGMIRTIPHGRTQRRVWYLGDLKVHPDYRGRHLPLQMLDWSFATHYLRCRRGYAISMDPPSGENRIVRMMKNFRWLPVSPPVKLLLYSLPADAMAQVAPVLERHRGPIGFLSLAGIKDIVLESTGKPLPLQHVQWGALGRPTHRDPVAGATHMFAAPERDPLATDLRAAGLAPAATASVLHHGMSGWDLGFVLTSDI